MSYLNSLGWPGQRPLSADPFSGATPDWMRLLTPESGGRDMAALAAKNRPAPVQPGSSIWDRIMQGVQQAGNIGTQIGKNIGTQYPPAPGPAMVLPGAQNYQEPASVMPYVLLGGAALAAFLILRKKG